MQNPTPFENKKIRTCWDNTSKKRWFSVVDICAALRDCDYSTARNYWKWFKAKLQKNQPISITTQLKMQAQDGKLRATDVMDAEGVLRLIGLCTGSKVECFKMWVLEMAARGEDVVKNVEAAAKGAKDWGRCKVAGVLLTVRRKVFCVLGGEEVVEDVGVLGDVEILDDDDDLCGGCVAVA